MQKDNFLYTSLSIGFLIVGLVFFYEDYAGVFGLGDFAFAAKQEQIEKDLPPDNMQDDPLPRPITSPDHHVVKVDETAFSISQKYGLTINELIALNPTKIIDSGTKSPDGNSVYTIQIGAALLIKKTDLSSIPDTQTSNALTQASDFLSMVEKNCKQNYCPHKVSILNTHQKALEKMEGNSLATRLLADINRIKSTYYSNGLRKDEYKLVKHKYRIGETVYEIADKYGVKPPDIQRNNPREVIPKIANGVPVVDASGRVQYEIEKGSRLIVFEKIDK